jgi:hypothetical protein
LRGRNRPRRDGSGKAWGTITASWTQKATPIKLEDPLPTERLLADGRFFEVSVGIDRMVDDQLRVEVLRFIVAIHLNTWAKQ